LARRRPPVVHGVAVVDKPAGVTSHDVVAQLRRRFDERRIGHAGTLDPGATGVLVIGVGMVTRLLRFITEGRKRYTGEVVVGTETDSLDADGAVTAVHETVPIDLDRVREVVNANLVGGIEQVPPMVSALSVGGRRLHDLAREGIEVERAARAVTVHRFDVVSVDVDPDKRQVLRVEVECSAGTYVRVLAADLGRLLGSGAHLRNLRRTAVDPFTIDEAAPPSDCVLLPPIEAVRALAKVVVDDETRARIAVGAVLPTPPGDGPWAMVAMDGELLAVYEPFGDGLTKPAVVLPTATDRAP
jgi:tRNA pseudouridine55 synthase